MIFAIIDSIGKFVEKCLFAIENRGLSATLPSLQLTWSEPWGSYVTLPCAVAWVGGF